MAETAYITPSTIANSTDITGDTAWSDPTNASSVDGAGASVSSGFSSQGLKCTNLGSPVPAGATINRVYVEIKWRSVFNESTSFPAYESVIKLVKGGTVSGNNQSTFMLLPGDFSAYSVFNQTVVNWGVTLTASDVNASNFGVIISVDDAGANAGDISAEIDHVRMKIDYTAAVTVNSGFLSFM